MKTKFTRSKIKTKLPKHKNTQNTSQNCDTQPTEFIASCSTQENNLPLWYFNLKNIQICSLLDSGASISLLSPDLFEQIKSTDIKIKYLSRSVNIHTLNNQTIPFRNCIQITFKVENIFVTGTFYVTQNVIQRPYKMIIGFDFLKHNKITLDFTNSTLKLKNSQINFNQPNTYTLNNNLNMNQIQTKQSHTEHNNSSNSSHTNIHKINQNSFTYDKFPVKLSKKIIIQPHDATLINIKCSNHLNGQNNLLFEPLINKTGIEFYRSLHNFENDNPNEIQVLAHNKTDKTITLNKNMTTGFLTNNILIKPNNDINHTNTLHINNLSLDYIKQLRIKQLTKEDFDVSHIPKNRQDEVLNLLLSHATAFSKNYKTLGETSIISPNFKLQHTFPLQAKPYKLPHNIKHLAEKEIQNLLEAGIIEHSNSQYSFPIVFVKKKSNSKTSNPEHIKYRMTIDFRLLNNILDSDPYPVPNIKEILHSISGKKIYTVLDLHSAFFQIKIKDSDKHILSFVTESGHYSMNRLPFGTKISTNVFSRLMDIVLGPLKQKYNVKYFIDDVILGAQSIDEMNEILDKVLTQLEKYNLTIEPTKLKLYMPEIEFLGYKINQNGYSPSNKNITKISNFARPKSQKAVRSFIGLCTYFKSTIPNYASIITPLTNLTQKKDVKFIWSPKAEEFLTKNHSRTPKHISPPDFRKDFCLITDYSKTASAILTQKH